MKKIIAIFFISVSCIIVIGGVFRLLVGSPNSVDFQIFKSYVRGYQLHKLLGIVPKEFNDSFEKRLIERYDGVEILYVVDKKLSTHPYFVIAKHEQEIEFIKAYPYMLGNSSLEAIKGKAKVSAAMNLPAFNKYLSQKNITKRQLYEKYCLFLSRQESISTFKILENADDIDSLLSARQDMRSYLKNFPEIYTMIRPDEINLTALSDHIVYCWFVNHGVVQFNFSFQDGQLSAVDSKVIGFLGIEVPM